ncbi:unnamed protein product, partial [Symbiodinium sp. KB8]
MQLMCNKQHAHLPWGRNKSGKAWTFATSAEAEYPKGFCAALAKDVCDIMSSRGWDMHQTVPSHTALAAQAAQRQARRDAPHHGPSEYLSRVTVQLPRELSVPSVIPEDAPEPLRGIPMGSKMLQCQEVQKGGSIVKEATFGIFRTPDAFVKEALKMIHPFELPTELDSSNVQAMANILSSGVQGTCKFRESVLSHYEQRAACLEQAEHELKSKMHPEVREIMKDKRLLLLAEVLKDAGVNDQRASRDPDVAKAVWKETLEQKDKKWLRGPFTFEEIDQKYGGTWIASKRFGVVQGEKTRAVDDLSEFLITASVTATDKVILDAVDNII